MDALTYCNGCDAQPPSPSSPADYCIDCEREARAATPKSETWTTRVLTLDTPRGTRYQGVCIVGTGRPRMVPSLPSNARPTYRTRPLRSSLDAWETARGRAIHHNLYHAGDTAGHRARYCKEG